MRGGNEAHVHGLLGLGPHRTHGALLHRTQQFHLHVQGQVGHFIQKQRAALGGLKQAGLVFHRPGEAAFLVTEELALHQLGGDRTAVDGHEGRAAARAAAVDEPRGEFLAGAALTRDVHWGLVAGELVDHGAQLLHPGRLAQQAAVVGGDDCFAAARGGRHDCRRRDRSWGAQFERGVHQLAQHAQVHRLADEIEGPGLEAVHRHVGAAVGGDDGNGQLVVVIANQFDAPAIRQAHVGDAEVEALGIEQCAGLCHGGGGLGLEAHAHEGELHQLADVGFVVDDQGSGGGRHQADVAGATKVMRNTEPVGSPARWLSLA